MKSILTLLAGEALHEFPVRHERPEALLGLLLGDALAGTELLGFAVGPAIFAGVLAAGGYVSCGGCDISQPDSAKVAIALGVSVLPALLVASSLWVLRGYRLDDRLRAQEAGETAM